MIVSTVDRAADRVRSFRIVDETITEESIVLVARHEGHASAQPPSQQRRFINIYVNDNDIRFGDSLATRVKDGDSVTILPAVAGGARRGHA